MGSPYASLGLEGLHPRIEQYIASMPTDAVGRGAGVFDRVGSPRRWLWPALWVLGSQGVVFPFWGSGVPFTVANTQTDAGRAAVRTFHFPSGPRSMVDFMAAHGSGVRDEMGLRRRYGVLLEASAVNGALRMRSVRMWMRLGGIRVPIPGRVELTERWDDERQQQHVDVVISTLLVGRVYEYAGYFDYEVIGS